MSAYTTPIIRFGVVTPLLFNCLLLGGAMAGLNKVGEVRDRKLKLYQEQTMRLAAVQELEMTNAPKRSAFDDQKRLLQADPGQLFTRILDKLLPKYKEIELDRNSLVFPLDRGRLGRTIKTDLARVKSSFSGGLGPMQEALLQVEALMPQVMLEELKISRKADLLISQREHLVLEATHTCWKAQETAR